MSLFGSFRGLATVQQPSIDDLNDEHEGLAPEQLVDHLVFEPEPAIIAELAIEEGENMLGFVFQVNEADLVGQVLEAVVEDLLNAEQTATIPIPTDRLGANDVSLSKGRSILTTAGPAGPLPSPASQVLGPNAKYHEAFAKPSEVFLALVLSLASAAYHILRPVLLPDDEATIERARDSRNPLPNLAMDSEPLAFESSVMSKSIYFCH